jgi:hypothetical protein
MQFAADPNESAFVPSEIMNRVKELGYRSMMEFFIAIGLPLSCERPFYFYSALDCTHVPRDIEGKLLDLSDCHEKIASGLGWSRKELSDTLIAENASIHSVIK